MTRILKRTGFSIVLFLLLFLGGCIEKIEYKSITLNDESFNLYYEIGSLDLSDISFTIILNEEGEEHILKMSDFTLSEEDLLKLETPGTHTLTLIYQETLTYDLTVTMVSSEEYNTFLAVYKMGLAAGAINISYEEWLNSIRGEDGLDGKDGKQIYLQVSDNFIQYQYDGDTTWINLISLVDLTGAIGDPGSDGKEVTFSVNDEYIQWQYQGDTTWHDLIALSSLRGTDGLDGREVVMQVSNTHIQWKYSGDTSWKNLIELATLTGVQGVGISSTSINEYGELIIAYTDNTVVNIGKINVYHTIKYMSLNGQLIDIQFVYRNEEVVAPEAPEVIGYTFTGWDQDLSTISSDMTVTAQYQINSYTITFDSNGGSFVDPLADINHGSTVQLPIPIKEGYVFKGWYTGTTANDEKVTNLTEIKSNMTLIALWEKGIYTVKFVNFENHVFDEIAVDLGGSVTPPSAPSVLGYTFSHWSESLNNIQENLIVKAIYQINSYTITFNSNDGSTIDSITEDYQTPLIAPSHPIKGGYTFMGWYLDDTFLNPYTFTVMPANDFTLYTKWQIQNYSIEYELIDGINADNPSSYTIETPNITLLNPTKIGHTFDGWYDNASFTGESIDTILIGSFGDLILYAKWIVNPYDLSYEIVTSDYSTETSIYLQPNETIIKVHAGDIYSSLFTSMGRIFMWGANDSGQLGNGTKVDQLTPLDITEYFPLHENEVIIKVAYGEYHSAAITSLNRIFMWGENMYSQLGDGTTTDQPIPIDITSQFMLNPDEIITKMFLGNDVSSAITSSNRIFMWGSNSYDQLADGSGITRRTPVDMTSYFNLNPLESITNLTFSLSHSVAHTSLGRVFMWGNNALGQLGDGTLGDKITPTDMTSHFDLHLGETIVDAYAGGRNYSAALTSESRVFMWGQNDYAQLGDNTRTNKLMPTDITSFFNLIDGETITALGIGKFHNTAISSNHRIFTWGYDMTIQLGDYGFTYKMVPTDISSYFDLDDQETIIQMTMGEAHTFFLTSEKRLIFWGSNIYGQLGDGTTTQRNAPIELVTYTHLTPHVETYDYNTLIDPYLLSRNGYQFNGWYTEMTLDTPYTLTTMPANDLYLYGSWIPIVYDITYVLNEGIHTGNPLTYTIESTNIILNQPTKTGYRFDGWYDNPLFDGNPVTAIPNGSIGDLMLYAKWSINSYTITFDPNEGSLADPITQNYSTTVVEPVEPTKLNYTFDGWYSDETLTMPYTFTTMPAHDITLYAKWISNDPNIEYTINSNSISIDQYIGTTRNYDIPSSINGLPVTEIKASAFSIASNLEILYIPSSVTTIGENAFQSSNPNLVIMTPYLSRPDGWSIDFNPDQITVVWGYYDPISISALSLKTNGASVTIQGIFTGNSSISKYWIQDETGGIYIYVPSSLRSTLSTYTPSVEVFIRGTYNVGNPSYITIDSLDDFIVINQTPELPVIQDISSELLTSEVLSTYQGELVSLNDYYLKESISFTSGQPFTFTLTNGTYDILVSANSGIAYYALLETKLNNLSSGRTIQIAQGVMTLNNPTYQIELLGDDITVVPYEK